MRRRRSRYYYQSRRYSHIGRRHAIAKNRHRETVLALYESEHHNLARLVYRVLGYHAYFDYKGLRGEIWYLLTKMADQSMPSDYDLRRALRVVQQTGYVETDAVTGTYRQARNRQHHAS